MRGERRSVSSTDGVKIGLLSAGRGPALLLVHGGMGQIEAWEPIWELLTDRWTVTAMDRRGRGTSGDGRSYSLADEYADVSAVADDLAQRHGQPVDVFAHSYGATCTVGAASSGAPFRRVALYEPPGRETVPAEWVERVTVMIADGQVGRAMVSFFARDHRLR